ncbi:MAG: HNH endonuclease signature motif containing protein [Candidatus Micrarchaeota archaeon]|nr:HNH endonuclease signature motif containing protein [Candidatus Micrarchaeota archaeon]
MKLWKIPLTKGKFAIVDKCDFERLNQFKWLAYNRYAARATYTTGNGKQTWIFMHRLIANAPKEMEVDHINHNTFDNRSKNLRLATHQQNSFNHLGYGHRGITKITNRPLKKPFCVRLMISGKNLYLGYYKTFEEAREVWNKAAIQYYGDFAKHH